MVQSMNVMDNYFDVNKIPDYCSRSKLEKFYNAYLFNLHQSSYRTLWVTLNEIKECHLSGWKCIKDKYLEDSEQNKDKLAMDIYTNGTYFPVFVKKQQDGKYIIRDGVHRVYVMRRLIEKGYWSKRKKILVSTDELLNPVEKQRVFHIPMVVVDEFKQNYAFIYNDLNEKPLKFVDEDEELAEYKTQKSGYLAFTCLSLLLRNPFFEYKEKNEFPIKPSPVINNQNKWKKWRGY